MSAKRKRSQHSPQPTARLPTVTAVVASPYTPGTTDRVQRVLSTTLALRRAGRISESEYQAGEMYRDAYEAVRAGVGCALHPYRAPSGTASGRLPSALAMASSDRLADATKLLARATGTVVVEMVVGQGYSIEEAAASMFGVEADGKPTRRNRDHTGAVLRLSLSILAKQWCGGRGMP